MGVPIQLLWLTPGWGHGVDHPNQVVNPYDDTFLPIFFRCKTVENAILSAKGKQFC